MQQRRRLSGLAERVTTVDQNRRRPDETATLRLFWTIDHGPGHENTRPPHVIQGSTQRRVRRSGNPTELPLDALEMALWTRARAEQPIDGVIHHFDAGVQYTSIRYTTTLSDAGAVASIGTVGDSYDNAQAETLIGLYKTECVRPEGPWRGVDDLELATLNWVHWYNEDRLHTSLGYRPPVECENEYYSRIHPQQQPLPGELALH